MHPLEAWRLQDIERKADRCDQRLHEIDDLRQKINFLERENNNLTATIDDLRWELNSAIQRIEQLETTLSELTQQS